MEQRTTALISLFGVAIWVLVVLARPLDAARIALVASMVAAFVACLVLAAARRFFELQVPAAPALALALAVAGATDLALWRARRLL